MSGEVRQLLRVLVDREKRRRVWESGIRPCWRCGDEFEAKSDHQKFCSGSCRRRYSDNTETGRVRRAAAKRQQRAAKRAQAVAA